MGVQRAVRVGGFPNAAVFLDEYFAAGYSYPVPDEERIQRERMAFEQCIRAVKDCAVRGSTEEQEPPAHENDA